VVTPAPGDLGFYDRAFLGRHGPWITRALRRYFRASVTGLENLPEGPFLGVGNHSGATLIPDTLFWLGAYHASGREPPLLALAHDALFSRYPATLARALGKLGAVRADPALAVEALRQGFAVQVYPGGDHDACRSFFRRNDVVFAGRTGYVSVAQRAGVPIVPVASVGAHEALIVLWDGAALAARLGLGETLRLKTFPLSWSLPWGLWLGPLPGYVPLPAKIEIAVLPPIAPEGSAAEVDAEVRSALERAVRQLAQRRRFPWIG
jgi:1-acyl-sn-glycerol-3-phosphate acyltransferase